MLLDSTEYEKSISSAHKHLIFFAELLKLQYLCKVFRDKTLVGKESALLLVKSPNLNKEYTRHGAAHIRGLPTRVVYSGVWRYLQENTEGSPPLSLTINIVKSPSWLSAENSCKIRHYEKIIVIFNRYIK